MTHEVLLSTLLRSPALAAQPHKGVESGYGVPYYRIYAYHTENFEPIIEYTLVFGVSLCYHIPVEQLPLKSIGSLLL